ncbi:MAG: 1-acyl-sn-glycerol-3-phosphate acyltransferase [Muribaculaceae bacterium]|jgi:1-acyl-sn-glycerol-3-phosphate acyltransferase|nr:1-acyl-sn-glycerol-3-phosphate acyltransferase [Muribaculaceae bacterium]
MAPVLVVASIITALLTGIGSMLGGGKWWGYYPAHIWGKIVCWITMVKVSVTGKENIDPKKPYVFVANHQSAYDIFVIYGYLGHSFRWMMKKSLEKIPFIGWSCKRAGMVFVDNSSPAAIKETMAKARTQLQNDQSLIVFPEGSRTWNGKLSPFKKGAYLLAVQFGLPIVPITIDGAFDVMPRFKKVPNWGHVKLTIHKPIVPPEGGFRIKDVMEETYNTIHSSLPEKDK